ncbi:unnamed protein product [Umbelopsis ramanniana]
MPSSSNPNVRNGNQARLLEDEADLEYMKGNLQKMEDLTKRMTGMLDSFDGRLMKLEASILPIHRSTQNLTHLADNIDATLKSTESIVKCMDLPSKEEALILKGPDENNTLPYLQSIARLKEALEILVNSKLRATDRVTNHIKQLLKAGMLHMETLFRKWLSTSSIPIDAKILDSGEPPAMDSANVKRLSQLSTYLSSSETELGYVVDFTKPYIEIRSTYLSKSMHALSQTAASADRQHSGVYDRGSAEFLKYMTCLTKMFSFEHDLATSLLANPVQRTAALKGALATALADFATAGRSINAQVKRSSYQDVFIVFDILERFETECFPILDKIMPRKEMDTILELMTAFRGTALRSIYEFMEDVKGRKDAANPNLSNDGTVHELTSNTLSHLKRLWAWHDIVEPILLILGNEGWNNPVSSVQEQQPLSLKPNTDGRILLKNLFVEAVDQLNITLQTKSKSYRKPALAIIFLLNNFNHVLRQIRSPPLNAVFDEGREARFSKLVRRQMDSYQETWKPCIENLMDVTYVRGGAIRQSLGNNEKQQIKDKFRNFNLAFEETLRTQKTYAIPDSELRHAIIKDIKNVLLPMYSRFVEKYQATDFAKNPSKYIRWDKDQLDRMLNQLFEPTA